MGEDPLNDGLRRIRRGPPVEPARRRLRRPDSRSADHHRAPKTVIPKLRRLLEETRPSILCFWTSDGFVSNEDAKSFIPLLGQEVLPAVREMGKELGLWSPFEGNAPVSIAYAKGPTPVAA